MPRPLITTDLNIPAGTAPTDRASKLINESGVGLEWNSKVVRLGMFDAGGRLTLESGVPISTTNQTAKTLLYYTPYVGNVITLYSATLGWVPITFSEIQINVTTAAPTASRPFDVWVYNNAGTATMEVTSWGSATSRSTALAYQDHVLVKSGDATRRYVGTVYWNGSSQMEDSLSGTGPIVGGVWNYYNRVLRPVTLIPTTASWTYSTNATFRQVNSSALNQVEILTGVVEDSIKLTAGSIVSTTDTVVPTSGIGIDSSTATSATFASAQTCASTLGFGSVTASLEAVSLLGYRQYRWLEYVSNVTGATVTFYGQSSVYQSGLFGQYPR